MQDSQKYLMENAGAVSRQLYPMTEDNPSVDTILEAIKDICMGGRVIKIVLEAGKPYIYYEHAGETELKEESDSNQTLDHVVRSVDMVEFDGEGHASKDILNMFLIIENEGYEVSHALVGSRTKLSRSLGLAPSVRLTRLYGVAIVESAEEIPDDTLILCGSPFHNASPYEVKFAVKGNFDEQTS